MQNELSPLVIQLHVRGTRIKWQMYISKKVKAHHKIIVQKRASLGVMARLRLQDSSKIL